MPLKRVRSKQVSRDPVDTSNGKLDDVQDVHSNEIIEEKPKNVRIRMRRPPRLQNMKTAVSNRRPSSSHHSSPRQKKHDPRESPVIKSIKRMRIRGREHPKDSDSPSSSSSTSSIEAQEGTTSRSSLRESSDLNYVDSSTLRSRFSSRPSVSSRTVPSSSILPRFTPRSRASDPSAPSSSSRRYQITTQRLVSKQFSPESSKPEITSASSSSTTESMPASASMSASSTTEEFTVSPAAHVIRYTLDSNEVTSELSISQDDVNNLVNDMNDPLQPQKLVSTFPMPSDVFSLATHALMKHSELPSVPEKTATEKPVAFLPTFVPKSKKRGRFILAAASNG